MTVNKPVGRPSMPTRYRTQLRLEVATAEKVQRIAEAENRSMNAQIEYFIRLGIEAYERQHGPLDVHD